MSTYVDGDFLIALVSDGEKSQSAEKRVEEDDLVASPLGYLELLEDLETTSVDSMQIVSNLLDVVPTSTAEERQIILLMANHLDKGLVPREAFYQSITEVRNYSRLEWSEDEETYVAE